MIEVAGLSKRCGAVQILDSVSFKVPAGGTVALWGANGAGKSTTIRCILGLTRFEGKVCVGGRDVIKQGPEVRRLIGYVPQELPVFDMTVAGAMGFFGGLRGADPESGKVALVEVGLLDFAERPIRHLSGGMRRRLAVALALLGDPPILVLDEPTANLDERLRTELLDLLAGFGRSGKTLVIASHHADEVRFLAESVLVLDGGRLVHAVSPQEEVNQWQSGS